MTDETWTAPDKDGIITCNMAVGAVSTLRGRRKRRGSKPRPEEIPVWPSIWRALLRDWLKQGGARKKWTNLLKIAGGSRVNDVLQLYDSLLKTGLIEVEECREKNRWQPLWVDFLDLETIRELVGLTNREKLQRLRDEQAVAVFENPALEDLQQSLEEMPAERAIRRHEILRSLDRWVREGLSGTRRDFALFAQGDTKGLSSADWSWIEASLSLEDIGISRHTPAIWMRAPISMKTVSGWLDLRSVPDCIGITPETMERLVSIEGEIPCWRILENRTVFERVARDRGGVDGVIWVPGFAPSWWEKGVASILKHCPARALIACDPDPAGIEIAIGVGQVWKGRNLPWEPWRMDFNTLENLSKKKMLNDDDINRLKRLLSQQLPEALIELSLWMLNNGEKGEQEGITF